MLKLLYVFLSRWPAHVLPKNILGMQKYLHSFDDALHFSKQRVLLPAMSLPD